MNNNICHSKLKVGRGGGLNPEQISTFHAIFRINKEKKKKFKD
jgi:hypothetical protein